jgi:hypothetical protein
MTQLTLLTRAYHEEQLKQIERFLKLNLEGLDVTVEIEDDKADTWVKISVSGEDEAIATSYVRREFGFCPESLTNVERFATVKGYVSNPAKNPDALHVDIGVFRPETVYAIVPLHHMQATLADGRKLALKKIAELFGFCEGLPLSLKIVDVKTAEKQMNAEFSKEQLAKFNSWRESLLDRLIVLGSTIQEVKRTLRFTGLDRDIIGIEPLGMFEHALTCKLGTDAAGLISQVGRKLRNARFAVFNPRRIREFLSPNETLQ